MARNIKFRNPMKKFLQYKDRYPYKEIYPSALNNEVARKEDKRKQIYCLHEMSQMLYCLKKYDFDQARCSTEIQQFAACSQALTAKSGPIGNQTASSANRYPTDVVNVQLRKYTQPGDRKE